MSAAVIEHGEDSHLELLSGTLGSNDQTTLTYKVDDLDVEMSEDEIDIFAQVLANTRPDALRAEVYLRFCSLDDLKYLMTEVAQVSDLRMHFRLAPGSCYLVPMIVEALRATPEGAKFQDVDMSFELEGDASTYDVGMMEEEEETLGSVDIESLVRKMAERANSLRKVALWIPGLSESSWTIQRSGDTQKGGLVVGRTSWQALPSNHLDATQ
ncbi:hypothetical protein CERSUDRAFT_106586 [Gelatoporia subvermispora B]|uniref:Uncharacterized protein n=1 Tax=Ceriporiopsis subvermispora (strain B) TaxID=914234 RepID=M2RC54_CERS8|nr:hypothetical protein CERSUDRAFT_106586 [Gelatoporia subvermispora B]